MSRIWIIPFSILNTFFGSEFLPVDGRNVYHPSKFLPLNSDIQPSESGRGCADNTDAPITKQTLLAKVTGQMLCRDGVSVIARWCSKAYANVIVPAMHSTEVDCG